MPNPTMEHLTIDDTTYDIVDSTSGYVATPSSSYGYYLRDDGNWRMPSQFHDTYPPSYKLVMQTDGNLVMYDSTDTALWQTGAEGFRVRPFYMKTVSGTTTANGNISLNLSSTTYEIINVSRTDAANWGCIPFIGGSNTWYARVLQTNTTSHAVAASTSVTLRVTYVNASTLISNLT